MVKNLEKNYHKKMFHRAITNAGGTKASSYAYKSLMNREVENTAVFSFESKVFQRITKKNPVGSKGGKYGKDPLAMMNTQSQNLRPPKLKQKTSNILSLGGEQNSETQSRAVSRATRPKEK